MPHPTPFSNESWVVQAGGDVVEKRAKAGVHPLSARESLLYWFWWADYMMRNAGDFANAVALDKDFQREIVSHAKELGFSYTEETFSLPRRELEKQYFDRFDAVCHEIREAEPYTAPPRPGGMNAGVEVQSPHLEADKVISSRRRGRGQ